MFITQYYKYEKNRIIYVDSDVIETQIAVFLSI